MFVLDLHAKHGMLYGCIHIVNNYIIIEMHEKNISTSAILNELAALQMVLRKFCDTWHALISISFPKLSTYKYCS